MALAQRLRYPGSLAPRRYTLALFGVMLAWISLMLGALVALIADQPANLLVPPSERAINTLVILLIGWAFLAPEEFSPSRFSTLVLLAGIGVDFVTAFGAVAATIGNIGPGFGMVGPVENYAGIPILGKWLLIWCMLLGRLEIYTVIILLVPEFWRK